MKGFVVPLTLSLVPQLLVVHSGRPPCYRYEPDTVRLTGTLTRHMYYGAPGYGEDPKRDDKEIGFYLDLARPICTAAGSGDIDVAKTNVRRVQLVLDQRDYGTLRSSLGKRVTLRGTLSGSITGHHHTSVLLNVLKPAHVEP